MEEFCKWFGPEIAGDEIRYEAIDKGPILKRRTIDRESQLQFGSRWAMRIIFHMVVVIASATALFGGTPFRVTVTDGSGGPISGAMILLHWHPAGSTVGFNDNVGLKKDLVLKTDDKGGLAAELPPGFYDLFTSAVAFTPACRKIRLKGIAPSEIKIRLVVDPMVTKELGDTFEAVPHRP